MTSTSRRAISRRVQAVAPSGIRRFFDMILTMDDVISLGVGEPDFATPWGIREAAIHSVERGHTHYTSNHGLFELRQLLSDDLKRRYGLEYDPRDELLITAGVSEGLDLAMRAILDPGDEVIVPEPSYVSYGPCVTLAGGTVVPVATTERNGFRVTAEQIDAAVGDAAKALLLSYPNNPTGAVLSRDELLAIAEVAVRRDLIVISDEVYDRLVYGHTHTSLPSLPGMRDRTVLLGGFSKSYAMTGWRVAFAAAPPEILGAMVKIHQYTMLCAPGPSQAAAVEALRTDDRVVDDMVTAYNHRRRLLVKGLNDMGLRCFEPQGAFYAFPCIEVTGLRSDDFAEQLLKEERVAVVPGSAFGAAGEGYVRCCYAVSTGEIEEARERSGRFVRRRAG